MTHLPPDPGLPAYPDTESGPAYSHIPDAPLRVLKFGSSVLRTVADLPRQDRDNLVRLKMSSRAVFNAGRARQNTLSPEERQECIEKRKEFFED